MMSEYSSELGPIPGTILWRVTATGTEHRVLPDAVMDIIVNDDALVFAGPALIVVPGLLAVVWSVMGVLRATAPRRWSQIAGEVSAHERDARGEREQDLYDDAPVFRGSRPGDVPDRTGRRDQRQADQRGARPA